MIIKAKLRKDMESGYGHYIKYGTECDAIQIWFDDMNNTIYTKLRFKDGYQMICDIKNVELEQNYKWMETDLGKFYDKGE